MTIESQLEALKVVGEQQVSLLRELVSKFDHIGEGVSEAAVEVATLPEAEDKPVDPPLAEAAGSTNKRRKRRTKEEMAADKAAKEAAKADAEAEPEKEDEGSSIEKDEGELPPDAKAVKSAQEFKKELIAIGRASGQAGYVQTLKGVLADAGFSKAEKVPEDKFDSVIAAMTEAFADDNDI